MLQENKYIKKENKHQQTYEILSKMANHSLSSPLIFGFPDMWAHDK